MSKLILTFAFCIILSLTGLTQPNTSDSFTFTPTENPTTTYVIENQDTFIMYQENDEPTELSITYKSSSENGNYYVHEYTINDFDDSNLKILDLRDMSEQERIDLLDSPQSFYLYFTVVGEEIVNPVELTDGYFYSKSTSSISSITNEIVFTATNDKSLSFVLEDNKNLSLVQDGEVIYTYKLTNYDPKVNGEIEIYSYDITNYDDYIDVSIFDLRDLSISEREDQFGLSAPFAFLITTKDESDEDLILEFELTKGELGASSTTSASVETDESDEDYNVRLFAAVADAEVSFMLTDGLLSILKGEDSLGMYLIEAVGNENEYLEDYVITSVLSGETYTNISLFNFSIMSAEKRKEFRETVSSVESDFGIYLSDKNDDEKALYIPLDLTSDLNEILDEL